MVSNPISLVLRMPSAVLTEVPSHAELISPSLMTLLLLVARARRPRYISSILTGRCSSMDL